ncbi:hypothetical protein WKR88_17920 [Trinickia caryophylli]|uniref:Uncharacterized protein n=1 Tax=Trinickia caryophylli TaxID=28094 RepID=A0A1X7DZ40_TRICW|nr:hypothetical protein [Trinickia caryophylli]PMS14133.1 hypothetical protein C0Z17_00915 [Trinickia caryophylli]TRX17832.1 hypothetical protein FNF07_06055 [Trinickia caryophylli]WQE11400.1 hypothetical protein U0034_16860 [Trinickia caryophylli]SMF24105.1 hypothetical protein SAMN06295900_104255 [Trinickia caryophylli]GLU32561.1 hypothetical protein Busp01_24030 [Trinickia caryophylli]
MSKLFSLKEWVTLPDAATHLSAVFGEEVSEADLLQFSLEGRLTLSVNFVNGAYARYGRIVGPESVEWGDLPSLESIPGHDGATHIRFMRSLKLYEDRDQYVNFGNDVIKIDGVWDLPLLGGDRLDVEHRFQMLIGGHPVTSTNLEGSFVQRADLVCQLQESMDDNEYAAGSSAQLTKLKQFINEEKLPAEEGDALLKVHAEMRKKFLADRKARPASEGYYPAGGLPEDRNLVVRTSNLASFIQSVSVVPSVEPSTLSTRERESLQKQIGALALLLAEKNGRYKKNDGPSANAIADDVTAVLSGRPNADARGVSHTSLRDSIGAGIRLLRG